MKKIIACVRADPHNQSISRDTLLLEDLADLMKRLWLEFESQHTPEARFAAVSDRFVPLLHNDYSRGKVWKEHDITSDQVIARCRPIKDGSEELWLYACVITKAAISNGFLSAPEEISR